MECRQATTEEILELKRFSIKHGVKVSYRHFVREILDRRTEHGVAHKQHTSSKIRVVNGRPHVMYQGELHEVTSDLVTLESGHRFIHDLRIKSEYLP